MCVSECECVCVCLSVRVCVCVSVRVFLCVRACARMCCVSLSRVHVCVSGSEADGLYPGSAGSAGERDAARAQSVCQRESTAARGQQPVLL